jgi:hypothetical protein
MEGVGFSTNDRRGTTMDNSQVAYLATRDAVFALVRARPDEMDLLTKGAQIAQARPGVWARDTLLREARRLVRRNQETPATR